MASTALKCRQFRRDLRLLVMLVFVAFGVLLFAAAESKWIFAATVVVCGLINPSIRFVLLQRGVIRPAGRQTPKNVRFAEALLILAHMFRVMFAGLAPLAVASVAIELTTSDSHGIAHVIVSVLSGMVLWTAAIVVTCYMVKWSKRDLERLYHGNPPTL